MSKYKTAVARLVKSHPHSAVLVKVFAPLLETQEALVAEYEADELPSFDAALFAQGKSWMLADELPVSDAFLKKAVKKLCSAAAKKLENLKEPLKELSTFLVKNPEAARELLNLRLKGQMNKLGNWRKKYPFDENAATLLAMHLAGAVGRAVANVAKNTDLSAWQKGYCPICGSQPQATLLRTKEGVRSLVCSLCAHEWRFARTVCPVCEQDKPSNLSIFLTEEQPGEKAEGCELCKHYLLGLDMRKVAEDTPPELFMLCMLPLDMLMQERGYIPASADRAREA